MENKKIISVVGPTASGKSSLAMKLCSHFGRDLVSTDSMQIYIGMDIGTAKPSKEDQKLVKHHLIDIVSPDINYSVADYSSAGKACINKLSSEGRGVVLCGGTGLYEQSILGKINYSEEISDLSYRAELEGLALKEGPEYIHKMLEGIDPESAKKIHANNTKRVIRALEIYKTTGVTKTEHDRLNQTEPEYEYIRIGIDYLDRQNLVKNIDKRVEAMFEKGLIDEVSSLLRKGYLAPDTTAGQAIGYKETIEYINGILSLEEAKEKIKISTRQYAKRQLTWFRKYDDVNWLFADKEPNGDLFTQALELIEKDS
ncbi:MAG: tRNA (adenosine(37)-N6)-dimethylallyltransferase MiaA [Clostridiales bacterium]|nr:tRNA (adenosine(37)-N6)-dimethylallyltransferase MiaA [Clostridiales bacterium]